MLWPYDCATWSMSIFFVIEWLKKNLKIESVITSVADFLAYLKVIVKNSNSLIILVNISWSLGQQISNAFIKVQSFKKYLRQTVVIT